MNTFLKTGAMALFLAGSCALSSCDFVKDEDRPQMTTLQLPEPESPAENNERFINFYSEIAQNDSVAMLKAMQAQKGINFKLIEKKYEKAMAKIEKATNELNAAKSIGNLVIINEKAKKLQEVEHETLNDLAAYVSAIATKRKAEGVEYQESKECVNKLKEYAGKNFTFYDNPKSEYIVVKSRIASSTIKKPTSVLRLDKGIIR